VGWQGCLVAQDLRVLDGHRTGSSHVGAANRSVKDRRIQRPERENGVRVE
jgi:hypothetical protein